MSLDNTFSNLADLAAGGICSGSPATTCDTCGHGSAICAKQVEGLQPNYLLSLAKPPKV